MFYNTFERNVFFSLIILISLAGFGTIHSQPGGVVSQPQRIGTLTLFFVEDTSQASKSSSFVTLASALRNGSAVFHNLNSQKLTIDNNSDSAVFIPSGTLLHGGQQDRIVAFDRVVPAHSKLDDVKVFCAEHDRSTMRGKEPLDRFTSAENEAPTSQLKLVVNGELTRDFLTVAHTEVDSANFTRPSEKNGVKMSQIVTLQPEYTEAEQGAVWKGIEKFQGEIAQVLKTKAQDTLSPSSLELTMDLRSVKAATEPAVAKAFDLLRQHPSSIGIVYAFAGTIQGAELFGNHDLFVQSFRSILRSITLESEVEAKHSPITTNIGTTDVIDFLYHSHVGPVRTRVLDRTTRITTFEQSEYYTFDTKANGVLIHSSVVKR